MIYQSFLQCIRLMGRIIGDALFPIVCRDCGREGHWLCVLPSHAWSYCCWSCRRPLVAGVACTCGHAGDITGCWWLMAYQSEGVITRLWHDVKYAHSWQALPTLQRLVPIDCPFAVPAVIVPVPLHVWRYRQRGFNQAATIATWLGVAGWGVMWPFLERTRSTTAQQQLNRSHRLHNVRAAFWCPGVTISDIGSQVLLVDDVWTTGATLQACADALRRAGYTGRIDAVVLFKD